MYQIVIDNHDGEKYILHDSRSNKVRVHDAVCTMELNRTGTLTFTINPTHKNFDKIYKLKSEIYLFQDDECIFCGRVLNDETNLYNFKTVVCEGMLAYLLDSVQRAKAYSITGDDKIRTYLTDILRIHNSQVDDHKKFGVGVISEVDTSETFYKISSDEDTLTTLNKDLVESYNHTYLSAEFKNGKKVINIVNSDLLPKNNQVIQLGKNLLSLNRSLKGEEIATAIIPLGATTDSEETDNGTVDHKLDITKVNDFTDGTIKHVKGTDHIYDEEAVELYGWIFKTISFDDIEDDTDKLLKSGIKQLKYYSKLASKIELTAFDLHLINVNVDSFRVGQRVKVYSKLHDLINKELIVQKISIDLDNPSNTTITLGDEERIAIDVNSSSSKKNNDAKDKLDDLEDKWNNNDYVNEGYFGSDDYKNNFKDNFKDNLTDDDYKNNFKDNFKDNLNTDDYKNNFKDNLNDYLGSNDFTKDMDDYFNSKNGTGEITDLSRYALKTDVQNSFDTLANLLKEV